MFATAAFGSSFPPDEWYRSLQKPAWNPPSWLFGPVWTVLYVLNALAAWRVYLAKDHGLAIGVWVLHLIPNALWSYFFFGMKRMDYALVDITLLLCGIVTTIVLFYRRDKLSGLMLVPYFLWVSFASVLNWTLMSMNLDAF